jgi:acetylornithine deacetylase/succinyl-diaminopimelate desuccinylase
MVDRRLVPGDDRDAAIAELKDILALAKERFDVRAEIVEFRPTTGPATETALDHPIVKTTRSVAAAFNGNAEPVGFPAGCDLVHFRSLGAAGVVLGPGDLGVAHKPDEFVPIKEFVDATVIYRDTVLKMLSGASQ